MMYMYGLLLCIQPQVTGFDVGTTIVVSRVLIHVMVFVSWSKIDYERPSILR